jgi:hypothetical protein
LKTCEGSKRFFNHLKPGETHKEIETAEKNEET